MVKVFLVVILILIITIVILILTIKHKNKDIYSLKSENQAFKNTYEELNNSYTNLTKEMEIEKKHNKELAEKLANISCMSIDDVLSQLQND